MKVRKVSFADAGIGAIVGFQAHIRPFVVGDMNYYPMGRVLRTAFTIFGGAYGNYCTKHLRRHVETSKAGVKPAPEVSTNDSANHDFPNPQ